MRRTQRRIIDPRRQFDHGSRVARDIGNSLVLSNLRTCAGFAVCDHIVDRVAGRFRLGAVDKGDDVVLSRKRQRLAVGLRTVARDRDRGFGDALPDRKVRVGNDLIVRHANIILAVIRDRIGIVRTCFAQIAHGIAQRRAGPVRIDRGVLRNLRTEVIQLRTGRRGVPTVEDIARLGRGAGVRRLLILFDRLILKQSRRSGISVYKADREARRIPLGVEHQVGCRHRGEGIRRGQTGIGIPARKRIVAVYAALCSGRRPVICIACDGSVKLNVADCFKIGAAVEVVDLISVALIIEIVGSPGIRILIGLVFITGNLFRAQIAT